MLACGSDRIKAGSFVSQEIMWIHHLLLVLAPEEQALE